MLKRLALRNLTSLDVSATCLTVSSFATGMYYCGGAVGKYSQFVAMTELRTLLISNSVFDNKTISLLKGIFF